MQARPRIVIADRSALAANLYQILFTPLEATLIIRRRIDDALAFLHGRERIDLAIINTNSAGKALGEIAARIAADVLLSRMPKLFLVSERERQGPVGRQLDALPRSAALERPFHPDVFLSSVRKVLEGGGT